MSDFGKLYEIVLAYDRFVKNVVECAAKVNVAIVEGETAAVLSEEVREIMPAMDYTIAATAGIPDGCWFKYTNSPNITLSQPATATNPAQPCVVQPTFDYFWAPNR